MKNETVTLSVNDREIETEKGTTVLKAAQKLGIWIPTLCHHDALEPKGACRLCIVEIEERGHRRLTSSCTYPVSEGLKVMTASPKVLENRRLVAELLLARCSQNKKIQELCAQIGVTDTPFTLKTEDCVLCGLCVRVCHEKMTIGAVNFMGRGETRKVGTPFDERSEVCITCGACATICPTGAIAAKTFSGRDPIPLGKEFDENLRVRSNIDIAFPSAVPLLPRLDQDNCIRFNINADACGICQTICPADAIDFSQTETLKTIDVGSIIAAPGFNTFDPRGLDSYLYDSQPNVMTSLEFERMLSAGGPFAGHVHRLSDGREPRKIAWLQCIGSRSLHENARSYCSSVCCMYALKQSIIAKAHVGPELDTAIFFIDMRTFGTDFEKYLEKAKKEGVRLIRSRVHSVEPATNTGDLKLRYVTETGQLIEEIFDMVILSTGLVIPESHRKLAERLGIQLNPNGFVDSGCFTPVSASRPGIYACGVFTSPKDIPRTVMEASAAAAASTASLAQSRGTLHKVKLFPPERNVSEESPRVGVFVCNCGINIGGVVDVPAIVEYAKTIPGVAYAQDNLFSCSQDALNQMSAIVKEQQLNRLVVASCSPSTHEFIFREMLRSSGLNKYLFEMANIRNQCTWVHQQEPVQATQKCKDLVSMAVAKARLLKPLEYLSVNVNNRALVIGGGVAGMTSAQGLADQGFEVDLVEMNDHLGGNAKKLHTTWRGETARPFVENLIAQTETNPKIHVHLQTAVESASGFIGNFKSTLTNGREIDHGIVVLATGGKAFQPEGQYLYGQNPNVLLSLDLDEEIAANSPRLRQAQSAAFIQCVGSRIPERPYCSKVCCTHSVENAIKLKNMNPEMDVFIIYRDMRTYGEKEELYQKAREKGVYFFRYDLEDPPKVVADNNKLKITIKDHVLQKPVELDVDMLTLASAIVPNDNSFIANLYKVALNAEGFFSQAHAKIRPVDCATYGIFLAGLCQYPKPIDDCVAQGLASSSRASTILSRNVLELESIVSQPNDANCDGCAYCIDPCPYQAITLLEYMKNGEVKKTVEVNEVLCQGCGTCMATCPKQGINVAGFTLEQLGAQVDAALGFV